MTNLVALEAANARRWAAARPTRDFSGAARRLVAQGAKTHYQAVSFATGVPWFVIALIHERESSQNWQRSLAQGDPWDRPSVHVPAGRGPFVSWEEAAIDALVNCPPHMARNADWSTGGTLTKIEEYNGLGYASHGVPSPYVWSGTDQYKSGKYVRDGVYDANVVDSQLGCAGLLMAMMDLDSSISFGARPSPENSQPPLAPKPAPSPAPAPLRRPVPKPPSISNPAKGSIGAAIASLLSVILSIFKKGK